MFTKEQIFRSLRFETRYGSHLPFGKDAPLSRGTLPRGTEYSDLSYVLTVDGEEKHLITSGHNAKLFGKLLGYRVFSTRMPVLQYHEQSESYVSLDKIL